MLQQTQGFSILASLLGRGFRSSTIEVNGTALHYVRGGDGPTILLIHGFPQDWSEYHSIMPELAEQFDVISVDLRGVAGSTAREGGFDAQNLAEDLYQLLLGLQLKDAYVVGHDLGGMVAYALVRSHVDMVRGAMLLDQVIPGIDGWEEIQGSPAMWHMHFMQIPGLAEKLLDERQENFLKYFLSFGKFSPEEIDYHLNSYAAATQMEAALKMYRAFPENARFNQEHRGSNNVPIYLGAGEKSPFAALVPKIAAGLRESGFTHVETGLIRDSVHYLVSD
ncbi:MAG TPA: alpha/beta hydrolase, partial [Edaphobacter sp.]|nr:alpha/beta hydrolase [Edaphobacter sp.]